MTPLSHTLASAILTARRTERNGREDLVKWCEVRKRTVCYDSLREAYASRRAQINKRGGRKNAGHPAILRSKVVLPAERRHSPMRVTTDKMYYGNYRFVVEFDSGSETGSNQLTVWVAEKADIDTVPLKRFVAAQLLCALVEPERSHLHAKLEEERRACQQPFELEIANLQEPFSAAGEKQGQKVPEKVKRRARKLREQLKSALQRLEVEFARRELWPLDRRWFDRDTLQAQSRVFGEEFSLRDFYFEGANGPHIRNFCRKFALDEG